MIWPVRWSWVALPVLALACIGTPAETSAIQLFQPALPTLIVRLGYNGSVLAVQTPEPARIATPSRISSAGQARKQGLSCKGVVLVATMPGTDGNQFCVAASTDALSISFVSPAALPYVSQQNVACTQLRGASQNAALGGALVRVGRARTNADSVVYDGGRAQCDFNAGFGYAYMVEKQGGAAPVIPAGGKNVTRSISIPWNLLHLDRGARAIMVQAGGYEFLIPLQVYQGSASISADYAPFVRPTPLTSRLHDVELNLAYSPNRHHMLAASFAQNQSTVSVQRALSNALSLAPVSLGAPARMTIGQDLQTQSQTLFTFLQPSNFLEDQSLRPLFDSTPFSVNKLSSLSAGYAYGFSSDQFTAGAFYGLQAAGAYNGGTTATFILTTPVPSPEPVFNEKQLTAAEAPEHQPLRPPAPPGPFFESGTASTAPFELSFINAFNGSKGARDVIDALAFEGHLYHNQSNRGNEYSGQTFNLFGRLEHDFRTPAANAPGSMGEFVGESATFTMGRSDDDGSHFFQLRETAGAQMNDRFFAPSSGTVSWLAPLSGPVAHVTAAFASGKKARYYALDVMGFRLTNTAGDLAAQEGWQVTIPAGGPGWLLTGGTLTQTVSDRIAAINQGLISSYAQAIAQVPNPRIRPQRLANISLLSPSLDMGGNWHLQFAGGYNTGSVTACGATTSGRSSLYQCLTALDSRAVGGIEVKHGPFDLGVTDTSIQSGSVSAGDAARAIGTSGGLPGAVTGYISYKTCAQLTAAYANAAMVSGIPFPQQGSTFSSQADLPFGWGEQRLDVVFGYFNERALANPSFNDSGFSAVLRVGTTFHPAAPCGK